MGHRRAVGLRLGAAGRRRIDRDHPAGLDAGINWIDTAPAYGLGHSEEVVGQALKGRRDGVILATKCGLVWNDPSERSVFNRLKAASVRQEAEGSLRRLGVDVIDLYQIHWPNPDADVEEAWTEIARLIEEGKIRYAGVSNFSISQMRRAQAIHPVASLQPPYSLLDQRVEARSCCRSAPPTTSGSSSTARWHRAC